MKHLTQKQRSNRSCPRMLFSCTRMLLLLAIFGLLHTSGFALDLHTNSCGNVSVRDFIQPQSLTEDSTYVFEIVDVNLGDTFYYQYTYLLGGNAKRYHDALLGADDGSTVTGLNVNHEFDIRVKTSGGNYGSACTVNFVNDLILEDANECDNNIPLTRFITLDWGEGFFDSIRISYYDDTCGALVLSRAHECPLTERHLAACSSGVCLEVNEIYCTKLEFMINGIWYDGTNVLGNAYGPSCSLTFYNHYDLHSNRCSDDRTLSTTLWVGNGPSLGFADTLVFDFFEEDSPGSNTFSSTVGPSFTWHSGLGQVLNGNYDFGDVVGIDVCKRYRVRIQVTHETAGYYDGSNGLNGGDIYCANCNCVVGFNNAVSLGGDATPIGENCEQENGSIDMTTSGGQASYGYSWSNGASTEDITGLSAGTYTVTITDNQTCTAVESFVVSSMGTGAALTSSFQLVLSVLGTAASADFLWYNSIGSDTLDSSAIVLGLTDMDGSEWSVVVADSTCDTVTYCYKLPDLSSFDPECSAQRPANNGGNTEDDINNAQDHFDVGKLHVFPNPSGGEFQVEYPMSEHVSTLRIISLSGHLVKEYQLPAGTTTFRIAEDFPANGMYIYEFKSSQSPATSGKLMIQK